MELSLQKSDGPKFCEWIACSGTLQKRKTQVHGLPCRAVLCNHTSIQAWHRNFRMDVRKWISKFPHCPVLFFTSTYLSEPSFFQILTPIYRSLSAPIRVNKFPFDYFVTRRWHLQTAGSQRPGIPLPNHVTFAPQNRLRISTGKRWMMLRPALGVWAHPWAEE